MAILDKLYKENDSEIIEEFLSHWDFIIDDIDLIIERLNYDYESSLNELEKIFYTLQTSTAYLKLDRISLIAQLVEEVLESAKTQEKITSDLIDWLWSVNYQLKKWYFKIKKNEELSPTESNILNIPEGY